MTEEYVYHDPKWKCPDPELPCLYCQYKSFAPPCGQEVKEALEKRKKIVPTKDTGEPK